MEELKREFARLLRALDQEQKVQRLASFDDHEDGLSWLAAASSLVKGIDDQRLELVSNDEFWFTLWNGAFSKAAESRTPTILDSAYYPDEVEAYFERGYVIHMGDEQVALLMPEGESFSVVQAHPGGVRTIAPDLSSWIADLVDALEKGASPRLIASKLEQYVAQSEAKSFRVVSATGAAESIARAGESADGVAGRLEAYASEAPDWNFTLSHTASEKRGSRKVSVRLTAFEGSGSELLREASSLADKYAGHWELIASSPSESGDVLSVVEGVFHNSLPYQAERLAGVKQRGGIVLVGLETGSSSAPSGPLVVTGEHSVADLKQKLEDFVRASGANEFAVQVVNGGEIDERERLKARKLPRLAVVLSNELDAGAKVTVVAVGEQPTAPDIEPVWI